MTHVHPTRQLLDPSELGAAMRNDIRDGLTSDAKFIPSKYLYDDRGSDLFEQITALPEYYPTRTELQILLEHSDEIARAVGAEFLLELGSGASTKTRALLDAMGREGSLRGYVPTDVSTGALDGAIARLSEAYPDLELAPAVADFDLHLADLPAPGRRLFAFLGSTIGNYTPTARKDFFTRMAEAMAPGEGLLLGADLVKDVHRLEAAYDDSAGVSAAFALNVLEVLNRELDADFDVASFEYVAPWNATEEFIDMRVRATRDLDVHLGALGLDVHLDAGEVIRTEISTKFRRDSLTAELAAAGLTVEHWWTDSQEDFALLLARP